MERRQEGPPSVVAGYRLTSSFELGFFSKLGWNRKTEFLIQIRDFISSVIVRIPSPVILEDQYLSNQLQKFGHQAANRKEFFRKIQTDL